MGISYSSLQLMAESGAGLVTSKSITLNHRKGHPGPVTAEFEGGLLNCMGLCNPGIKEAIDEINSFKSLCNTPVITSIFGISAEEFVMLTDYTNNSQSDFIELNLSCPNVRDEFGTPLAASASKVNEIVKAVKSRSTIPVIAKLSPNVIDIREIALAAEEAGADALCMINTLGPGMAIDIQTARPVLSNVYGGISGPCIKPAALRLVHMASSVVSIPIIGMGGITSGEDAIEMLMAGASLVGIGTAIMEKGISVFNSVNEEINAYMKEKEIRNIINIPRVEKHR